MYFQSPIGTRTLKVPVPYPPPNVEGYTRTPSHKHSCSAVGAQITSLGRMISSCSNYLLADVSDGGDWSLHQQEVTDGQLVTISLVPGTVDSDVSSECHLFCPPPLPTGEVSSLDGSWGLCASRLNWKKWKYKWFVCPCLFPLLRRTEAPGDHASRVAGRVTCCTGVSRGLLCMWACGGG